jgi:SRSO17 transposase
MRQYQDTTRDAIKTTLQEVGSWVYELLKLHARIALRFARPEPRRRALSYLQAILSPTPRKNGWQIAEHARECTPYGMQRLLSDAVWDADAVRDDVLRYVLEFLCDPNAILALDETSFPKRGRKSAGVQRQYCGTTGRVENCQVAVFASYVSPKGHALIDRELYLPQGWTQDPQRCREAGIPETVEFQTKCELAQRIVQRLLKMGISISWVVADTVYGGNLELRIWLEVHGYAYVLAVPCDEPVAIQTLDGRKWVQVREVEALLLKAEDWQRLSMSQGTKGPRLFADKLTQIREEDSEPQDERLVRWFECRTIPSIRSAIREVHHSCG